ncbi:MAG: Outer membrane protein OprM precursor [Candidatus Omnitrophica bacterium ADurb.Bin277]|nr:MAG: Outer membrane protein OprM precursor [Candidatus Omnitrophica bacterium ADurb.Bin277]
MKSRLLSGFALRITVAVLVFLSNTSASPLFAEPASNAPLTLDECYRLALVQSETIAIQEQAIKRAEAQIFTALSHGLGDVNYVWTRQLQDITKEEGGNIDPDRTENKFTFSQPLFQGFKAMGAITGAGSYTKEQKQLWIRAKQLLYLDVARAFYTTLKFRKDILILKEIHTFLEQRIEELGERERLGRSRQSEVLTARSRLQLVEADEANIRGLVALAEYELEFLTGVTIENRNLEETADEQTVRDLSDYLDFVETRPDVRAADYAVKTSKRGILVAQSAFWPSITFNHNQYMRREGVTNKVDWDALFTVNVPLFSGTETVGQVKDSISQFRQKKLSLSLAKRSAALEIRQSYRNWIASREELEALKNAVASANENYKLQVEEYRRSLVNNLDVLVALQSLNETMRSQNLSHYKMKGNEAAIRVATGEIA